MPVATGWKITHAREWRGAIGTEKPLSPPGRRNRSGEECVARNRCDVEKLGRHTARREQPGSRRDHGFKFEFENVFRERRALLRCPAFTHDFTKIAGVRAVESFLNRDSHRLTLRIIDDHFHPGHGLQNGPVTAEDLDGGQQNENAGEAGLHWRARYAPAGFSASPFKTQIAPA